MTTTITRTRAVTLCPALPTIEPEAVRPNLARRILHLFAPVPGECWTRLFREAELGTFRHRISLR